MRLPLLTQVPLPYTTIQHGFPPLPPLAQFKPATDYVTCDVCGKTAKAKGLKSHKNSIQCYVETELKRLRAKDFASTSILRRPRCIRLGVPHEFGPVMARSDFKRRQGHILYGLWVPQWVDQIFLLQSSKKWTDKAIKLCLDNEKRVEEIKYFLALHRKTVVTGSLSLKLAEFVNEPFMKEITNNNGSKPHKIWFHPDGRMFVCCESLTTDKKKKTLVNDALEVTAKLMLKDQLPLCWAFALQLIDDKSRFG